VNWLLSKYKVFSLVNKDIAGGIVPKNLFEDKSMYARVEESRDIDGGIVPWKLYPDISNLAKSVRTDSADKYNGYN
jgi:hypothetical protein